MGKATGFIDYERLVPNERDPLIRLKDWKEYTIPLRQEELQKQGARCMDCGTPYCQTGSVLNHMPFGCPVYNLIPEWNDLVYRNQWREALDRLHKTNNFPEFTGRVCPAPCEGSCTVALNGSAVTIKSIEKAIVEKGFSEGWIVAHPPSFRTGKKVAVVGSGPAGLAAAAQLNQAGHWVTVYERHDRVGGLLTYGIPSVKLEKKYIERRVDLLKEEGITFITNTEVGRDISAEQLQQQYDAIILCGGATKPRDIDVEGRHLSGIHFAMDYLHANTKSLLDSQLRDGKYISAEGKDVIVIGGGDTGADCVATALRHQCASIHQFWYHPRSSDHRPEDNPWPQFPKVFSLEYAHEEALAATGKDPRQYNVLTKKFVGDEQGQVKEVHTIEIKREKDEQGNVTIVEIPGTERVWPAQLVLLAIGFKGSENLLLDQFQLEKDERSNAKAAYGKYTTNIEGVFAAGDIRRGQSLVVWAINEGREAARECDKYLMGSSKLP